MSAYGGNYNAASANAGANYDGISSGGMASQGTYAVDPSTGQNIGSSTPGSSAGTSNGGVASGAGGIGSMMSMLGACCWIYFEAYMGAMPEHVRQCRDEFAPESSARRAGYRRMAMWLVPAMRVSKVARILVWMLMVYPMSCWGGFHKGVKGYENCWVFRPFVWMWFKIWEATGSGVA
jgi:hypothetical protein